VNRRNKRLNTVDHLATNSHFEPDVEKVVLAQIQYCRFMNLVFD